MNSPTADKLLHAVRRRLRLQHVHDAARFAAWTTVAIAAAAVLLHLFVRPVSLAGVALSLAVVWSVALLQAAITTVQAGDCAAWADRHLGGHSGYAAYLEHVATAPDRESASHRRLLEWIDQVAQQSVASLRAMPRESRLLKPMALALVTALLAAVLLQVPTQSTAIAAAGSSSATTTMTQSAATPRSLVNTGAAEKSATAAKTSGWNNSDSRRAPQDGGAATPVAANERKDGQEQRARTESQPAEPATRAASGGRDAGDSPDTAPESGLSEAWQGAMASKMRPLSEPPTQATRTDATLGAEFAPASSAGQDATAMPAPPAAVPPAAGRSVQLGPAEQAYVRAYFAGSGATP